MRRDLFPWLLFLGLTALGALAWLTARPDGPALARMTEWPVVGPAAARLRDLYRPPPPSPPSEPEIEYVILTPSGSAPAPSPPPPPRGARPRIWIGPETPLFAAPDRAAGPLRTANSYSNPAVLESRGDWYRIALAAASGERQQLWVHRSDAIEPERQRLWQPDPVLPLAASPPAERLLDLARRLMLGAGLDAACGPYLLLADVTLPGLEVRCQRLAASLDEIYAERYGLVAAGPPAGAILVFRSYGGFLAFRAHAAPEVRHQGFALPARGLVALAAQGRTPTEVEATVVHELAHLANRRFVGPALPPWLDEGLANDLAFSRRAADGALLPGTLGGWQSGEGVVRSHGGGAGALLLLQRRLAGGRLPSLEETVRLDRAGFQVEADLHYALSAFWIRFLLSGEPRLRAGLRSFLAAVAAGEPISGQLLVDRLGRGWPELEDGFRGWLRGLDADVTGGAPAPAAAF